MSSKPLSRVQQMLLDIALQAPGGIFYPHPTMWHARTHKHVEIRGAGYANAIKALIRNGRARALPALHEYAFEVIKESDE